MVICIPFQRISNPRDYRETHLQGKIAQIQKI